MIDYRLVADIAEMFWREVRAQIEGQAKNPRWPVEETIRRRNRLQKLDRPAVLILRTVAESREIQKLIEDDWKRRGIADAHAQT